MKRRVIIKLNKNSYRKLLIVTKMAGYPSIQSLLEGTIRDIPMKLTTSSLYIAYQNMIQRCVNPRNPDFKYYGAKKLYVCDRWFGHLGLEHFLEDVPPRREVKNAKGRNVLSLDRINNEEGYYPGNVRWSNALQQNRTRSKMKPKKVKS